MASFTLAVLASGKGSNCQALQRAIESGQLRARIGVVISNQADAGVLDWARQKGLAAVHLSSDQFEDRNRFHDVFLGTLREHGTNLIVLAGYLKKIGRPLLAEYPGRIVNIHPALLPAFGGKGMYGQRVHEAVIEYGARITGVTVHLVDEEYDHGPIILQEALPVLDEDTPETLAGRVLELEHQAYAKAIQWLVDGRIAMNGRRVRIRRESVIP